MAFDLIRFLTFSSIIRTDTFSMSTLITVKDERHNRQGGELLPDK